MPQDSPSSTDRLGTHVAIDLEGCVSPLLEDLAWVREILLETARIVRATVISDHFHRFSPQGISGVVIIAESHVAIHTWPEHMFAAVDIFTCGSPAHLAEATQFLRDKFEAQSFSIGETVRGAGLPPPRDAPR